MKFNNQTIERHIDCIKRLQPDTKGIFGSLDANGMLCHLRITFDTSIGDPEAEDISKPIIRTIIWVLFCNWITEWPGGKIKAPAAFTLTPEYDFEEERRLLIAAMHNFVEKLEANPNEKHVDPMLGPITLAQWSQIHILHCHHHFKQFQLEN